jgi:hypothetical protein
MPRYAIWHRNIEKNQKPRRKDSSRGQKIQRLVTSPSDSSKDNSGSAAGVIGLFVTLCRRSPASTRGGTTQERTDHPDPKPVMVFPLFLPETTANSTKSQL